MKTIIVYLLAITGAEVITTITLAGITTVIDPTWGIVSHIAILVAAIVHSAVATEYRYRRLVLSLALVPLVRIMSLSMPLSPLPQIYWYPIIYIPILVAGFVAAHILGYRMRDIGITVKMVPVQLAVSLTGFFLGMAEHFILTPKALITELTWQEALLPALIFLLCTGFVEEFIFRGVLQRAGDEAFGWWGIVGVGYLFAILHIGFLSWLDLVFVFAVALFFSWVVKRTGSLLGVSVAHGITNMMLYLLTPFLF